MAEASEQLAQVAVREHMASTRVEMQREAAEHANQELETKNQELQERAIRDPLTTLYNRAFFAEALNAAIGAASRSAGLLAVLFSDIDLFKRLNDNYGHQFGDEVLCKVARIHIDALRRSDVVARYGGEEFVVLVHQPNEKGLEKLAERLRQAVEGHEFSFERTRVPVTISIGAAIAPSRTDPADLAAAAGRRGRRGHVRVETQRPQPIPCTLVDRRQGSAAGPAHRAKTLQPLAGAKPNLRYSDDLPRAARNVVRAVANWLAGTAVGRAHAAANRRGAAPPADDGRPLRKSAVSSGLITEDQLSVLLAIQAEPPNLLARTLTTLGLLEKRRADELLAQYRDFLSEMQPNVAAVV